jgi:hypothetical protein
LQHGFTGPFLAEVCFGLHPCGDEDYACFLPIDSAENHGCWKSWSAITSALASGSYKNTCTQRKQVDIAGVRLGEVPGMR